MLSSGIAVLAAVLVVACSGTAAVPTPRVSALADRNDAFAVEHHLRARVPECYGGFWLSGLGPESFTFAYVESCAVPDWLEGMPGATVEIVRYSEGVLDECREAADAAVKATGTPFASWVDIMDNTAQIEVLGEDLAAVLTTLQPVVAGMPQCQPDAVLVTPVSDLGGPTS